MEELPFCALLMDCEATSLGVPTEDIRDFLVNHLRTTEPFIIKARLAGDVHIEKECSRKVEIRFTLQQVGQPIGNNEPPPMGADW